MRAMVLEKIDSPLEMRDLPTPEPKKGEVLLEISTCAVCRTDLHIRDGELPQLSLPRILGHQVVGKIVKLGSGVKERKLNERVGVAWLGTTCGACDFCLKDQENLCDKAVYTGYGRDGGFAEFCVADENSCYPLPKQYDDAHAAPLLCAGMIGYRSYRFARQGKRLGLYGFGAAAHLLIQVATAEGKEVYVFTRKGDETGQKFAKELGATWAGDSETQPPKRLDAAIIFAPVGALVPHALEAVKKAGVVVCGGIHMSDIPSFPYKLLWEERVLRSIANLTRKDALEFLQIAERIPLQVKVNLYPLEKANQALQDLKEGKFSGSAVLQIK